MNNKYTPIAPAILGATVFGALSIAVSLITLLIAVPVYAWINDSAVYLVLSESIRLLWSEVKSLMFGLQSTSDIPAFGLNYELLWRAQAVSVATGLAAGCVGVYLWLTERELDSTVRHVSGRRVLDSDDAIQAARLHEANAIARCGQGLWLAPDVMMSKERETLQIAIMGSVGGGKTQIFMYLIEQAVIERGDKALIHDLKGDFVSQWPTENMCVLSPTCEGSWAWDIGKDVYNMQRARELAARLIPQNDSGQKMWTQGSRSILTGLIVRLQRLYQTEWTWRDILTSSFMEPNVMKVELERHYPEAAQFICVDPKTGEPNLTSYGFFVGVQAPIAELVGSLSAAWSDVPPEKRISLVEWMLDDDDRRPIILQRSSEYPLLSSMWIGAALDTIASLASSNRLTESRCRRIWLFLDEFASIDVSKEWQQVLLVGRSRGICAVLGLQDPHQLTQKFDDETRKIFSTVIGTTIICRFNAGDTAQHISETILGKKEIERTETSVAFATGGSSGGGKTTTTSNKYETVPVLAASELEKLGPRQVYTLFGKPRTEIEALVLGYGDALRVRWPLTIWPKLREGNVPAAWLSPPTPMPPDLPELLELLE